MNTKLIGARSKAGRNAFFAAGATTVGLFFANYVPHTFAIDYYRDFVRCYQNGEPVPISERVLQRFSQAIDLCQLEPYERALVKPFSIFGFDISLAGYTKSRFGAIIGIPTNYEYGRIEDIKRSEIRFQNKKIDWESESGKFLEESLVLTEDEQVFGFCKALMQVKTQYVLLNAGYPSISFLMVYSVGHYLNSSLGLLARPFSIRFVMYSILGLFGLGSWCFMKDYTQVLCDTNIDKALSAMGPRYVQAGVSYYDKQLKKNIALKKLLNDNTFTAKGNVNYLLRQKSMPLTVRKSFFESKLETAAN